MGKLADPGTWLTDTKIAASVYVPQAYGREVTVDFALSRHLPIASDCATFLPSCSLGRLLPCLVAGIGQGLGVL